MFLLMVIPLAILLKVSMVLVLGANYLLAQERSTSDFFGTQEKLVHKKISNGVQVGAKYDANNIIAAIAFGRTNYRENIQCQCLTIR